MQAKPAKDIELTPEWQNSLYRHCFSPLPLHCATEKEFYYPSLLSKDKYGFRVISPLQNYFVTLAEPPVNTSSAHVERGIDKLLQSHCWHIAKLGLSDQNSEFLNSLEHYLQKKKLPYELEPVLVNWQLHWNRSSEEYFEQLPSRLKNTLKRKKKQLSQQHSWELKVLSTPEEVQQSLADYKAIYEASWKPEEEHIDFIEEFLAVAANKGWLRLGFLKVENKPVAAQIWFVYQGKATIFKLAYRPDWGKYSVGSLLTEHLMRHVMEKDHVKNVDYGMGDEAYKADWMNHQNTRYQVIAFNNRSIFGKLAQLRYDLLPKLKKKLLP